MKKVLVIFPVFILFTFNVLVVFAQQDVLIDPRDQQEYKIVQIGETLWFAENLNFTTAESECYEGVELNCEKYGRLYTYYEASNVCPDTWRLPYKQNIKDLKRRMKSKSFASIINKQDWNTDEADIATNRLGLSIKPGGRKYDAQYIPKSCEGDPFFGLGISASFWLGGEKSTNPKHWHVNHFGGSQKTKTHKHGKPPNGAKLSVLCIKSKSQ